MVVYILFNGLLMLNLYFMPSDDNSVDFINNNCSISINAAPPALMPLNLF